MKVYSVKRKVFGVKIFCGEWAIQYQSQYTVGTNCTTLLNEVFEWQQ